MPFFFFLLTVNDPTKRTKRNGRGFQKGAEAVGEATTEGRADAARVPHGLQAGADRAEPGEER